MKFLLFVEGDAEQRALPNFVRRWLECKFPNGPRVGVDPIYFSGWSELVKDAPRKARLRLNDPKNGAEIIAIIGLLDLYGPDFYPKSASTAEERIQWATKHLQEKVGHPKYHQYFAVHELEAWLLSDSSLFPAAVRKALPDKCRKPETVNFQEPPKKLLRSLFQAKLRRSYKSMVDTVNLFSRLEPKLACEKCPHLKAMLEDLAALVSESMSGGH